MAFKTIPKHYSTSGRGTNAFSKGHWVRGIKARRHFRNSLNRNKAKIKSLIADNQKMVKVKFYDTRSLDQLKNRGTGVYMIGIEATKDWLRDQSTARLVAMQKGINDSAILMIREVKYSIKGQRAEPRSWDNGMFFGSIDHAIGPGQAIVFSRKPYAKYLEYGTRGHMIKPKNKQALHWKPHKKLQGSILSPGLYK